MDFLVIGQSKRFYDYPMHSHDLWELLLNLEGEGTAIIDGQEYPFTPGTIFCIRPKVMHCKKAEQGFVDGSILVTDFCFDSEPENVLVFQDDDRHSFQSLFQVAYKYPLNPDLDVYAERFLRSILDAMQNLLNHWKNTSEKNPEIQKVQKYLADHVTDSSLDIEDVVSHTPYSPNYFRKLFKEECGCSPLQYYNQLKVQLAKQQILQHKSVMTINEIARNCGFEDPYYFSRIFKKVTGYSPIQYYKQSMKDVVAPTMMALEKGRL